MEPESCCFLPVHCDLGRVSTVVPALSDKPNSGTQPIKLVSNNTK